jgi:hypothetical protein
MTFTTKVTMQPNEENSQSTNPSLQPSDLEHSKHRCPTHASMRHDAACEQAVDVGIHLQKILTTHDAAKFMRDNVVDFEVALRVLLHPFRRRRTTASTQSESVSDN